MIFDGKSFSLYEKKGICWSTKHYQIVLNAELTLHTPNLGDIECEASTLIILTTILEKKEGDDEKAAKRNQFIGKERRDEMNSLYLGRIM